MEFVHCDLCGAKDTDILIYAQNWKHLTRAEVNLVRCRQCGLMYLNPRPTAEEINQYYPEDYACFRPAAVDERLSIMRWFRRRNIARRRRYIEKYSRVKTGNLLDVGCSTGLFLNDMDLAGWDVKGVEPIGAAAEYARTRFGLEIFQGFLEDAPYQPETFDVITYWDVLEHTFSPTSELLCASKLMRANGLLAINIPNWHSPDRRLFGPYWIGLDPPRHLYVFNRTTMTAILRMAGFQPLNWVCLMPSYFAFVISLERWLNDRNPQLAKTFGRIFNIPGSRFLFHPYFALANWVKWGGVITVFAEKT